MMASLPTEQYTQFSPQELLRQYSPSLWSNRDLSASAVISAHIKAVETASQKTKSQWIVKEGVEYGTSDKEKLDIILPDSLPKDCPILVYIHGGYWKALGREMSTFAASPVLSAGAGFVAVGYDLAPKVSMRQIVQQVRKAVQYVLNIATQRKSRGVYLCGHSAGAHLAAMMIKESWNGDQIIKGAVLVSGVFDVRPLVDTEENNELHLTREEAWDLSPFHHVADISKCCTLTSASVCVAIGEHDSPEFRRQSMEFYKVLSDRGVNVSLCDVPGTDHFTVIEQFSDETYSLTKELLKFMQL